MLCREGDVLLPRNPSDQNPDDWPQFNIKKIKITSHKTGRNVSLLSAHSGHPVKVSGQLEAVDDDLIHLVRDKRYEDKVIELDHVTTYAFAEYDDGTCGFWAAGKAGWFEIQSPHTSYKANYDKMNEAASIFYMLADRMRRAHKMYPKLSNKALNKYAKSVFQDYFVQRKDPSYPADIDEAQAAFHEHKEFLITSMLEGQDGLDWIQTPMLNYFKLNFPDEYAMIEERVLRPGNAAQANGKAASEDKRDSSRKRKSQSPHEEVGLQKKQKRKAAQQAEARLQLLPKGLLPKTPPASQPVEVLSSDEEANSNINVVTRKRKSILQPSGGKYSRKAAGRRKGLPAAQESNGSQDDEDEGNDERAQTEESPIITLRNAKDLELLTNPSANRSSPDATPGPKFLPRKYLELKVVEYDLPSMDPQGPGDLWTCTFEGCFTRVHKASTSDGKARIKEHFKAHASQAQEKIDLVLNESRPYLPVNNLMRRLQAFAPVAGIEADSDSLQRKFSAPIRRRY